MDPENGEKSTSVVISVGTLFYPRINNRIERSELHMVTDIGGPDAKTTYIDNIPFAGSAFGHVTVIMDGQIPIWNPMSSGTDSDTFFGQYVLQVTPENVLAGIQGRKEVFEQFVKDEINKGSRVLIIR